MWIMKKSFTAIAVLVAQCAFAQTNLTELGKLTYSTTISDVWGYVDTTGHEYALVGVYDGVSIVDVDTPSAPKELFFIGGPQSTWRDMMTWQGFGYCSNETDSGILIMDLRFLPDSVSSWRFGASLGVEQVHNLWIDEKGYLYLFGSNLGLGGAEIFDLADPANPDHVAKYNDDYIHDGFVRGDTLWAAEVNSGEFNVLDVSDTNSIVSMGANATPHDFTHNVWPSDDNATLFTTDEKEGGYLASYNVSDLSNISELDRYRSPHSTNVVPHNTHFLNDYLITSWYSDGIIVVDAQDPSNMIEVGFFDTAPFFTGTGFNGCWGAYPYLPSGTLLATDVQEGLFLFNVNYQRAAYLHGNVTDASTTSGLNGVSVSIMATSNSEATNIVGNYKTGNVDAGSYSVIFYKTGYHADTIDNVILQNDSTTILDVALVPKTPFTFKLTVLDSSTNAPLSNAQVRIEGPDGIITASTDGNGELFINPFFEDTYNIYAGLWGWETYGREELYVDSTTGADIFVRVQKQYYDDFTFDLGWTASGTTLVGGEWVRDVPLESGVPPFVIFNPGADVAADWSNLCYVTGNTGLFDFVGGGTVTLRSPKFNLLAYNDPYIHYYRWFANYDTTFVLADDDLRITISNGTDTEVLEEVYADTTTMSQWLYRKFRVDSVLTPTNDMRLNIAASADLSFQQLLECGFDMFYITEGPTGLAQADLPRLKVTPNPTRDWTAINSVSLNATVVVHDILGRRAQVPVHMTAGKLYLSFGQLEPGIYVVSIIEKTGTRSERVIKH
jgi:choice-of-anchor B domain-containing protein